jgi:ubiquinone/menaquinone biosynthesis C-methylase UbiE
MGRIRRIIDANTRLSMRLDRRIDPQSGDLHRKFVSSVEQAIAALPSEGTAVDLGGGRHCAYVNGIPKDRPIRLVAVDISEEELAANTDVTETRVANIAEELPFGNAEVDLVVSRMLLEHVDGVPDAISHMARVLKPGGKAVHFFPCRYSLFATAARYLPFGPLLKILHFMIPSLAGEVRFDVFYDHCYPSAAERLFLAAGFRNVAVETTMGSKDYFLPVFPLYVLVAAYETVARKLGARSLMGYVMVTAER